MFRQFLGARSRSNKVPDCWWVDAGTGQVWGLGLRNAASQRLKYDTSAQNGCCRLTFVNERELFENTDTGPFTVNERELFENTATASFTAL